MKEIFTKEEQTALNEVIDKLSKIERSSGDLFDIAATLVSDIADIYQAYDDENIDKIEAQKKDAINTAISLISALNNF